MTHRRFGAADLDPVLRGLSGPRVAVALDGFRLDSPAAPPGLAYPLGAISPDFNRRTEVVRGPLGTPHGHGALGGIVAVRTKRREHLYPGTRGEGFAAGRFATASGERSGYLSAQMNARKTFGLAAHAGARQLGDVEDSGNREFHTAYRGEDFSVAGDTRLGDRFSIGVTAHRMIQDGVPVLGGRVEDRDWTLAMLALETERLAAALRFARVRVGYGEANVRTIRGAPDGEDAHLRMTRLSALFETPAADFLRFIYGADYSGDTLGDGTDARGFPAMPDGAIYRRAGAFFAPEISAGGAVRLRGGLRVERAEARANRIESPAPIRVVDYGAAAVTWGASTLMRLSQNNSLVGGYERGFRFPTLAELAADDEPTVEQAGTAEVGWRMHYAFVKGALTAYHTWIDDPIGAGADEARVRGVEWRFDGYLGINWNLGVTMAYQEGVLGDDDPLPGVPPFLGQTHLLWLSDTGTVGLDAAARFAGEQGRLAGGDEFSFGVRDGKLPPYFALDLRMMIRYASFLDVKLGALNLTGARVWETGSTVPETGPNFAAQAAFHFD
ncbi:MAG: TonB-dependent receptor [Deltaproteobacteria bacterium]|nr:TonB-dependent receptor [Deltaproteobacteria bacterium]